MLSVHDKNGYTAMDRLIEKLPDAAFVNIVTKQYCYIAVLWHVLYLIL